MVTAKIIAAAGDNQNLILFQIRVTATYRFIADITLKLRLCQ